jgi:K(+)-stimulated pyrophosphate-energized sodium pump
VRISDDKGSVQKALNLGNWTSIIITTIACYFVVMWMMPQNMTLRALASQIRGFSWQS